VGDNGGVIGGGWGENKVARKKTQIRGKKKTGWGLGRNLVRAVYVTNVGIWLYL
jgi:hypothetical protein